MPDDAPRVDVVMVAYGDEELLGEAVAAVLASTGVRIELVVVDNGFSSPDRERLAALTAITWVRPGRNTGFTGGCNRGAAVGSADRIVFVNSDAVVEPGAVARLVAALRDPSVGATCGKVVLYDRPDTVNSVGNPVHYSLFSWSGGWGDPAGDHTAREYPASITGCLFGLRRRDWESLGGFFEALFAYGEDVELSIRTLMAGQCVLYEPGAVARHQYDFHRNPGKRYLLERNRLINILTLYERRTLLLYAPALLAIELGVVVVAFRQGWLAEKVRGWRWIVAHQEQLRARRTVVQGARAVGDDRIAPHLGLDLPLSAETRTRVPALVNCVLAGYGRFALRQLRRHPRPLTSR